MININTNEKKKLRFNIRVSGVEPKNLLGSMKIMVEGVEYGFPITIDEGDIVVNVSPLSSVTGREFKDGETFNAQLDIIAGDVYLKPWTDTVRIENPMKIEATLTGVEEEEVSETIIPTISVASLEEEKVVEKKEKKKVVEKKHPKTKFGKMLEV